MYSSSYINKRYNISVKNIISPDQVLKWSNGAVEKPDTNHYRTGKPISKWIFCESIFGPVISYECNCGKYKWDMYAGIVCEKCGVELCNSNVRRDRMWHIELAVPILNVWFIKEVSIILNLSPFEIEQILNYEKYAIVDKIEEEKVKNIVWELYTMLKSRLKELDEVYEKEIEVAQKSGNAMIIKTLEWVYEKNKQALDFEFDRIMSIIKSLKKWSTILESDFRSFFYRYTDIFDMKSWAEAIQELLSDVNIEEEIVKITEIFKNSKWEERKKIFKLLRLLINLHISDIRPEWMIIKQLPVIPPAYRWITKDWKDHTSYKISHISLLYKDVIQINLKLKRMIHAGIPDIVKKNEIRLLQESVNNLFYGNVEKTMDWSELEWLYFRSLRITNKTPLTYMVYLYAWLCQNICTFDKERHITTKFNKIKSLQLWDLTDFLLFLIEDYD